MGDAPSDSRVQGQSVLDALGRVQLDLFDLAAVLEILNTALPFSLALGRRLCARPRSPDELGSPSTYLLWHAAAAPTVGSAQLAHPHPQVQNPNGSHAVAAA